jgi:hypothetical protein
MSRKLRQILEGRRPDSLMKINAVKNSQNVAPINRIYLESETNNNVTGTKMHFNATREFAVNATTT